MKNETIAEQGRILIVDDDLPTRRGLGITLSGLGFSVIETARGKEAVALVRAVKLDAVLLDVDMPGMDGLETCKVIRQMEPILPILMLTVLDSEDDKVLALECGADDYITKPFHLRELTARLRSAVRRRNAMRSGKQSVLRFSEIELDRDKYQVTKNGRSIRLTPKEFEVLAYLMTNAGEPVSHARILKSVWGPEYGNEREYLRTFVRQLRTKIEDDPGNPRYLLTDSYVGYRFNDKVPEPAVKKTGNLPESVMPDPSLTAGEPVPNIDLPGRF